MTNNTALTKNQVKAVAADALAEGRLADALLILTDRYDGRCYFNRAAALVELAPLPAAKVGDVLVSSWGYDQTNVDFYQVIAVTRASVRTRKIGKNYLVSQASRTQDMVVPAIGAFIDQNIKGETHRIQKNYGDAGYNVTIASYASAYRWDGKPRFETAFGYGH